MNSQVFYRKWRPQTLAEVVGQEQITQTLLNALQNGQVAHAYLFCGPRGTGKTSTGRILAKAVNCLNNGHGEPCNGCSMCQAITEGRALDMIEIDAASTGHVEDVRNLREKVNFAPNTARYKVYIIDEAHMLTDEASNALLKTLEEPPPHAIFILATTEPHKMLPTILSRCQRFDFRRISQSAAISRLEYICDKEGIHIEPEALRIITRSATGSLRDAENLLEQLHAYYGSNITLLQAQDMLGISGDLRVKELANQIINKNVSSGLATINSIINDGLDLNQFNRELVQYLRDILLVKSGVDEVLGLSAEEVTEIKSLSTQTSIGDIVKAIKLFGQADISFDNYYSLPLELALVECALPMSQAKEMPAPETVREPESPAIDTVEPSVRMTESEDITPPVDGQAGSKPAPPQDITSAEHLKANWKTMLNQVSQNIKKTSTIALMRSSCTPVAIENDTVVLEFSYPIHKDKMETPGNRQVAEEIISNFLGHPCHIRCILKQRKTRQELAQGHLVKAAIEMGAEIVSVEEKE